MADDNQTDVNQLNSFLKKELAAVTTYDACIEKVSDSQLVSQLSSLKASHQRRAEMLGDRVRSLGGQPVQESSVWGGFARLVEGGAAMLGRGVAVTALAEGENYGRDAYREEADNLSSAERLFVLDNILPEQERTHKEIRQLETTA